VPHDASAPVHTFWDLGFGNHTSIWCAQRVGLEWRILKYYENRNHFLPHYLAQLQTWGAAGGWLWGTDYLPHDGRNNQLGGLSIEGQLKAAHRRVVVL
jgi:phage terminase large subunit